MTLDKFPKEIGDWHAIDQYKIGDSSMAVLLVDDYLMRNYINGKDSPINLYIGYYKNQREGKQVHSPRQCLPGSGWNIIHKKKFNIKTDARKDKYATINYYLMGKGMKKELYLWWYQGRGRIYASEYFNKLILIWDSILKKRTDGALVRISMPVGDSVNDTFDAQIKFINKLLPILADYIPG